MFSKVSNRDRAKTMVLGFPAVKAKRENRMRYRLYGNL